MARLLILGGGIAGQTAALHAKKRLGGSHEVAVVTPNSLWNWIPSNIWVGVGLMKPGQVTFPLAPVYKNPASPTTRPRPSASIPKAARNSRSHS